MLNIKSKDIIALSLISVFGMLKLKGINGSLDIPIALIVGYYFAKRANKEDNGN